MSGIIEDLVLNSKRAREASQHGTTQSVSRLRSSFIEFKWIHCHLARGQMLEISIMLFSNWSMYVPLPTACLPKDHIVNTEAFKVQIGLGLQAGLSKSTPYLRRVRVGNDRCQ